MNCKARYISALIGCLLIVISVTVSAEPDRQSPEKYRSFQPKHGMYISFLAEQPRIGGDFDGQSRLVDDDQSIILPRVKNDFGYGISVGGRGEGGEAEVSYAALKTTGNWRQRTKSIRYYHISVQSRAFLFEHSRVTPLVQFEVGFSWIKIIDGSRPLDINEEDFWFADSRFFTKHWGLGGGVAFYATSQASLRLIASYRFATFHPSFISGVAGDIYTNDKVNANAFNISMRLVYVL